METTDQFSRRMRALRAGRSVGMQKQVEFKDQRMRFPEQRTARQKSAAREAMTRHPTKPGRAR